MKFIKYGFGRATDQICIEIRAGRMTRDEGIQALRETDEGTIPMKYVPDFLEYLKEFSFEGTLISLILTPPDKIILFASLLLEASPS